MLLRLEIGLKLERLLVSRSGFLSKGVSKADLKHDGKHPSAKDRLAKRAISWEKTSEQETISGVGMKSIGDDLGTMLLRRFKTSKKVTGGTSVKADPEKSESSSRSSHNKFAVHLAILHFRFLILFTKNAAKLEHIV